MEDKNFNCWLNIIEAECNGDNLAGGGDRPLGEKLPDRFEVKDPDGIIWWHTNGLELHRLVLEDYDQLERRSKELDKKIIDAKCSTKYRNEVSESLPLSPLTLQQGINFITSSYVTYCTVYKVGARNLRNIFLSN